MDTELLTSSSGEAASGPSHERGPSLLQSLLTTLESMGLEYEAECQQINNSVCDAALRMRMLERLREFYLERREPYLRQTAILQQRNLSHPAAMMTKLVVLRMQSPAVDLVRKTGLPWVM